MSGYVGASLAVSAVTIVDLFQMQAALRSDAVAVVDEDVAVTYGTVNARANMLARVLIGHGIGSEDLVAVAAPRSVDMIVALLAIMKAGAVYVPLDSAYPAARLAFMIRDANPACLLTTAALRDQWSFDRLVVVEDAFRGSSEASSAENVIDVERRCALFTSNAAYMIYTSGSTGTPKGAIVTHESAAKLLHAMNVYCERLPSDVWTLFHSYAFDFSVWEIWGALTSGARLVLVPHTTTRSAAAMLDLIAAEQVTILSQTPTAFYELIKEERARGAEREMRSLRYVLFGGEALDFNAVLQGMSHYSSSMPNLVNLYGITETTVIATASKIESSLAGSGVASPIGEPLPDLSTFVLTDSLEPVPSGVSGELYIGGAQLGRGYWNRAGMTAGRFIANPYGPPGTRLYRSGDLVRRRRDGRLEYIGRADEQVKLRGFRIELGEIEAAIRTSADVNDCVVVVHGEGDGRRLIAYVTAKDAAASSPARSNERIDDWERLFDSVYVAEEQTGDFNLAGWVSSYTGTAIPATEMREWRDETVARLRRLDGECVLEVGCGTGLLLTQLAPTRTVYRGVDISGAALAQVQAHVTKVPALRHVQLERRAAHELADLPNDSVDLLILNSVIQYFPDVAYCVEVIREAARVTRPGGHLFIGDVRSLPLLEAYHTSVQVYQAKATDEVAEVGRRIQQACRHEEELVLDPQLFETLSGQVDKIGRVQVWLKGGTYENEVNRFRYDVVIEIGAPQSLIEPEHWVAWDAAGEWCRRVRAHALSTPGASVGVRRILDRRTAGAVQAMQLIREGDDRLEAVRRAAAIRDGEDPARVIAFAREHGMDLHWRLAGSDSVYDVILNPSWRTFTTPPSTPVTAWRRYANVPARSEQDTKLAASLTEYLRKQLPEYMVPATVVVLDRLPLTPNGKVDRQALPEPVVAVTDRGPRTADEEVLCELFATVLGLPRVGIDDNFFTLGGHSLLAVSLVSRIRTVLGVELQLDLLFQSPTVAELAPHLREDVVPRPPIGVQSRPNRIPLSYAQQRLWFIDRLGGARTEYNMIEALRLRGALDVDALRHALITIITRHEVLRTYFTEYEGEGEQVVRPNADLCFARDDFRHLTRDEQDACVRAVISNEGQTPFELGRGPLLRVRLLKLSEDEHVLVRTLHHIVSDGWSQAVFNRELILLYAAYRAGRENPLAPLPIQYADFSIWQRGWLDGATLDQGVEYWRQKLAGIPELLRLPTDRPRPPRQTFDAEWVHIELPPTLVGRVKALAHEAQATLYMTLLAAFGVLLSRYTGQQDIVIGSPTGNRYDSQLEELIGFFVNTLVLRMQVGQAMCFRELLDQVRQTSLEAFRYQDVPFERVVEVAAPQRNLAATPVVQVQFALQNAPTQTLELPYLHVERLHGPEVQVRCDLEVHVQEHGRDRIGVVWIYNRDLFDRWRMERMAHHFARLLHTIVASPDAALASIAFTDECEPALQRSHGPVREFTFLSLYDLFQRQVARVPDATALRMNGVDISYATLDARAGHVAEALASRGVGPEDRVGVSLRPSVDLIVAILGVLRAGAAYVPLDPSYPSPRLVLIATQAAAGCVITDASNRATYADAGIASFVFEGTRVQPESRDESPSSRGVMPANAAYVMFTSGTTGTPKGVVVSHSSVHNFIEGMDSVAAASPGWRHSAWTPASFDVSVYEMFSALLTGGTLVIADEATRADVGRFHEWLLLNGIESAYVPPFMLPAFAAATRQARLSLRRLLVGVEPIRRKILEALCRAHPSLQVVNGYGPTETTVCATVFPFPTVSDASSDIECGITPIGKPLANTQVFVLDNALHAASTGIPGEIYVAGLGVARGYWDRPRDTAERFVPNPYGEPGSRMYRTGDIGLWRRDGQLEYLGRADDQVKVRGTRVELGEIEAALRALEGIHDAAAGVKQLKSGESSLVGYVVSDGGRPPDPSALRRQLLGLLPGHSVPAAIVVLDRLPFTANGKLDRLALPVPAISTNGREPRTPAEVVICSLAAEVLGLPRVTVDDNFFELGGHSLLATKLVNLVQSTMGVSLPLQIVFEAGRIGDIAERVTLSSGPATIQRVLALRTQGRLAPLFCLPPASGVGWGYMALVRRLSVERPLYCLQAPQLAGVTAMPESMEAVALDYLRTIQSIQPSGPYHLLGWSFGGYVAHVIAHLLQQQAQSVGALIILDTYPSRTHGADVHLEIEPDALPDVDPDSKNRFVTLMNRCARLASDFVPCPFDGDMLLFAATRSTVGQQDNRHRLWLPYVTGTIDVVNVDCTHQDLLKSHSIATIGSVVERRLATSSLSEM